MKKVTQKQTGVSLAGVTFLIVIMGFCSLAQPVRPTEINPPVFPELPTRALRKTNITRLPLTNAASAVAMEALDNVKAESERRRQTPLRTFPRVPAPHPGVPARLQRLVPATNQVDLPHPPARSALYQHGLSDSNLPPPVRKAYEILREDTQKNDAEFRKNQQLWDNLFKVRTSGSATDVAKAKGELADFLAAFSKRVYEKAYPAGTSLEVIIADFKARAAASTPTPTNTPQALP